MASLFWKERGAPGACTATLEATEGLGGRGDHAAVLGALDDCGCGRPD
jgi:hypothetical protein